MWYVYILQCSNNTFYVGITNNVKRRLKEHNSGKGGRYTKARAPVTLVYSEAYKTKAKALKREIQIKRWTRAKKNVLIKQDYKRLKRLSHSSK